MRKAYFAPHVEVYVVNTDELLQTPGASQIDNDGDGNPDTRPVIPEDPEGGIGAKPFGGENNWMDWGDE